MGATLVKTADSLTPISADMVKGVEVTNEKKEETSTPVTKITEVAAAPATKKAGVLKLHIDEGRGINIELPMGFVSSENNFAAAVLPAPTETAKVAEDHKDFVRRELKNIIAFWMDKGVDGFRVDMAQSLIKRDDRNHTATMQLWDEILSWFNKKYPEGIMMSEWSMPHEAIKAGFNIDLIIHNGVKIYRNLVCNTDDKGKPNNCYFDKSGNGQIKEFVTNYGKEYQATRNLGYATMPTCSHDIWRLNRLQRNTPEELKVALTLFLTMPWPPIIYYGEEIGMRNLEEAPYKEGSKSARNRSSCRTPMQWETGLNAGFSSAPSDQIYLPIDPADNYPNVASQENDRTSILNYVRTLLEIRKNIPAIGTRGDWKAISDIEQPYPFAYMRWIGDEQYFIVLNPSGQKAETAVNLPDNSKIEWLAGTTSSYRIKTKKGETRLQMPATSAILCKIRTK